MKEPNIKARISQLHKTEKDWNTFIAKRAAEGNPFIPAAGELIIYDADIEVGGSFDHIRIKAGDGKKPLDELDFFISTEIETILRERQYSSVIDAGNIASYLL